LNVYVGLKVVDFHVFGNIPETAWRVFKAAKRPILFCTIMGSWRRNRLAGIPGRQATHGRFSVFQGWDEAPGGG